MTDKDKILKYLEYKRISKNKFYQKTGFSVGFLDSGNSLGVDKLKIVIDNYHDLNLEWFFNEDAPMIKPSNNIIINKEQEETRPRIPMDAAAGFLTVASDGVTIDNCEQLPVIKAFARYDFTIFARGDSMEPEYHSGDELACLYVRNTSFIQWGRIHVIDTAQGVLVKRIFDGGDSIICKSDNPNYPDFRVDKAEFYNVALVIGMIRRY